jgi:hypothetical protein
MKKRLLQSGLILLLAAALAPFFVDFVREVVVIPLLYLFWLARFVFESFPQDNLWLVFLGLVSLIMLISLIDKRRSKPAPFLSPTPEPGRVESWEALLRRAQQDDYFKWRLAQQLQRLTLAIIAHQEGETFQQARLALRQGRLELPPQLLAYFQASLQPLGYLPQHQRFFSRKPTPSALNLDPHLVIHYLEELQHGSPNSEEKL